MKLQPTTPIKSVSREILNEPIQTTGFQKVDSKTYSKN